MVKETAQPALWVPEERVLKMIMLGDSGVGKSALVSRFTHDVFAVETPSTIGIAFAANGDKVRVQLWDTAGQERFTTIASAYYRGADGIVIAYDQTEDNSITRLQHWIAQVIDHCDNEHTAVAIAGTKSDLKNQKPVYVSATSISATDILGAESVDLAGIFETSSSTGQGVEQLFQRLVDVCVEKKQHNENLFMKAASLKPFSKPPGDGRAKGKPADSEPNTSKDKSDSTNKNKNASATTSTISTSLTQKQKTKSKLCTIL